MSDRALAYIEKEEAKSEKIASVAQLVFLCGIFGIYHFSPKGFTHSTFEPVKVLFLSYGPILLLRLFVSWREQLQGLKLYLFLSVDLIALISLIWSFHIQYDQPVTLSLRSPSFLYFFIFLAIRCLSYDFKKVLFVLTGSIALWLGVLIYALSFKDILITSNFAEFLLPNTLLIGMEVDKLIALTVVGGFLATAIFRKRNLLNQFAKKSIQAATMERLIGKRSLASFNLDREELQPGRGVRRNSATLMVDLRGFSKLSYEISPEEILSHLGEYQKVVARIIFRNNGSIDKYLGDGILAHFGAVNDDATYARGALVAAEQLNEALETWKHDLTRQSIPIDYGIAVTVGEVIFGVIGHEERMEITTIGESVNLSAKLEKHTKELKCRTLTTKKTYEMAKAQGFTASLGVQEFPRSAIAGIPHTLDVIGLIPLPKS